MKDKESEFLKYARDTLIELREAGEIENTLMEFEREKINDELHGSRLSNKIKVTISYTRRETV